MQSGNVIECIAESFDLGMKNKPSRWLGLFFIHQHFQQNAGNLNVGDNLGMSIGGNYDIGAVQTGEHKVVERAKGVSNTDINQTTGSSIRMGGVSQIGVGGDLTATGANIDLSGGGTLAVNDNVTLQADRRDERCIAECAARREHHDVARHDAFLRQLSGEALALGHERPHGPTAATTRRAPIAHRA